jgi:nitrate/TMAO reductase-like tetraheme cytochrome c subunit
MKTFKQHIEEEWKATIHYSNSSGDHTHEVTSDSNIRKDVGKKVKELKSDKQFALHKVEYH